MFTSFSQRTGRHSRMDQITLMDWGNAIVRSKTTDGAGTITSLTMELNLDGDFRKTKKITWLAQSTDAHPLVNATLIDYDYLITKKKLEEADDLKDFVTPVTEFRQDALVDANVRDLKPGDIIQFERRGYYVFDRVVDGSRSGGAHQEKTLEFIHIPDGRAAGLASKASGTEGKPPADIAPGAGAGHISGGLDIDEITQGHTKMYKVDRVVGEDKIDVTNATKMYKVESVYGI
jgi:glutamyl-tRNA synthetase